MVGCGCMVLLVVPMAIKDRRCTQARVGVMELGRLGCPVDRLPDSPRHERGAARCLLGTGANPKVWNVSWGCVLWVQLYTSDQSKTIRIAVPAVMGGRPDSP
uniref:Uncharacterized protein n=1 Tax=Oryza sativa subsp. japonica TaxID=39947 RepID=Q75IH3_ORYSJ|nr:unknown protein [Oryza sativa Japonica Group]